MRIDRLALTDFKNLVDFEVDFDETSNRQVVVGRNGVGKSNLLEAITRIFRDLDLEEDSDFGYEIEYLCNGHFVMIKSAQTNGKESKNNSTVPQRFKRQYWIASEAACAGLAGPAARPYEQISELDFFRRNRPTNDQPNADRLLPLYVFGYYSGTILRFAKIFEKHEEKYFKEQISGKEAPLRPLFQAKPNHSQFALLAFYATRDSAAQKFLKDEFRILGLDSVLFSLREPYWRLSKPPKDPQKTRDPRFWFAGGKVAPFTRFALHPLLRTYDRRRPHPDFGWPRENKRTPILLPA